MKQFGPRNNKIIWKPASNQNRIKRHPQNDIFRIQPTCFSWISCHVSCHVTLNLRKSSRVIWSSKCPQDVCVLGCRVKLFSNVYSNFVDEFAESVLIDKQLGYTLGKLHVPLNSTAEDKSEDEEKFIEFLQVVLGLQILYHLSFITSRLCEEVFNDENTS